MKKILLYAIILLITFTLNSCGEDSNIATIGEEVNSTLVDTNVTDDTKEYDDSKITIYGKSASSFAIINGELYACGLNTHGNLGLGDTTNRNTFVATGVTGVKKVFAGASSLPQRFFGHPLSSSFFCPVAPWGPWDIVLFANLGKTDIGQAILFGQPSHGCFPHSVVQFELADCSPLCDKSEKLSV